MPWKHRKKFLSALREYFLQMRTNLKRQTAPHMLILTQLSINGDGPKVSITSSTEIQMKLRKIQWKKICLSSHTSRGRKKIDVIFFIGSRSSTTLFLYASRMFISIADMCGYVYTPEVYPTSMRGIGLGACSGAARIGCMITPFVAMVSEVT